MTGGWINNFGILANSDTNPKFAQTRQVAAVVFRWVAYQVLLQGNFIW